MRLAWFTPLPPARTGIAAYSAEVLPMLGGGAPTESGDPGRGPIAADAHEIDVYVDSRTSVFTSPAGCRVYPSRDFAWQNVRQPYDLVVYQLGNSPAHDYMWPYLVRFPGLVVLHDAQLHHSRALALLNNCRHSDYRAEFGFCHPDARPGVADAVISATAGFLFYIWPLVRVPIESARAVAVHTSGLAGLLEEQFPGRRFEVIRMGVSDALAPGVGRRFSSGAAAADAVRTRHGIPRDAVLFAAFGMVTPEKRVPEILRAFRGVLSSTPSAHLMLVGQAVEHYDARADAEAVGVADRVTVTGYVADQELSGYLHAADVCLSLRWPTSRETSAAWLRSLSAGQPTIINDLVHMTDVPALDPRSWRPLVAAAGGELAGEPVCVAIDILDEQHSLGLAMRRLASDGALRSELGRAARRRWRAGHTLERMAADYNRVVAAAAARPIPDRSHLPPHLLRDASSHLRDLLAPFGITEDRLR